MILRAISVLGLIALSACATVPATMDPTMFAAERTQIAGITNIVAADAALTSLLSRTDLTPEQRSELLFLRADKRWSSKYNLPGAIEDFDAFAELALEDPRLTNAKRDRVFAATEVENAQRRLARLQNLSDWFDDKVLMGDLEDGAERYRAAGLTPSEAQLALLKAAGFVCEGSDDPVHVHGTIPEYAEDTSWCMTPTDS